MSPTLRSLNSRTQYLCSKILTTKSGVAILPLDEISLTISRHLKLTSASVAMSTLCRVRSSRLTGFLVFVTFSLKSRKNQILIIKVYLIFRDAEIMGWGEGKIVEPAVKWCCN